MNLRKRNRLFCHLNMHILARKKEYSLIYDMLNCSLFYLHCKDLTLIPKLFILFYYFNRIVYFQSYSIVFVKSKIL